MKMVNISDEIISTKRSLDKHLSYSQSRKNSSEDSELLQLPQLTPKNKDSTLFPNSLPTKTTHPRSSQKTRLPLLNPSKRATLGATLNERLQKIQNDLAEETTNVKLRSAFSVEPEAGHRFALELPQETLETETHEMVFPQEIPRLSWCPYCRRETTMCVEFKPNRKTFWSAVSIFLTGGVCGCFMIPYALSSCKTPQYRCTRCNHTLN